MRQWFSAEGNFSFHAPPPDVWSCLEAIVIVQAAGGGGDGE